MFRRRGDRRAGNDDRSIQVECWDSRQYQFTLEVSAVSRNAILINPVSFIWFVIEKTNCQCTTGISLPLVGNKRSRFFRSCLQATGGQPRCKRRHVIVFLWGIIAC